MILSYEFRLIKKEDRAGAGNGASVKHYLTDVGWLSMREMTIRTGMTESCLKRRMTKFKTGDSSIFAPEHLLANEHSTAEWKGLSSKPRDRNLAKIPNLTPMERKLCA
jgi:hypothetical protein